MRSGRYETMSAAPSRSDPPPRWVAAAVAGLALAAGAALLASTPATLRLRGVLLLVLVVAGVLVELSPVRLGRRGGLPLESPVVLAAPLLLDPFAAALAAATGPLLAAAIRPVPAGRDLVPAGRASLQALVAGLVWVALGWQPAQPVFDRLWPLLAVVPAAAAASLVGPLSATVAARRTGQGPPGIVSGGKSWVADGGAPLVAQIGLAVLVAGLASARAWMLVLLLPPVVVVQRAFARQERLRRQAEAELAYRAFHDALTGLPNREFFAERLATALARFRSEGRTIAVLFLDLDRFKLVNDTLGHSAGDRFLVAVADRLRSCVRPADTVARIGGDEFTVLLDGVRDRAEAVAAAERILAALAAAVELGGHEVAATASIGIVLPGPDHRDAADLLRDADAALYQAKEAGRDGYAVYEPGSAAMVGERLRLEADLRRAVARGELLAYFQPRVDLASGRTVAVEAAVWWPHPERGVLEPEAFRRVAEETGLIVALDRWLLAEASRQAADWRSSLADPPAVAVAISGRSVHDADLVDDVSRLLGSTGLPPTALWLDVRAVPGASAERTEAAVRQLHRLGVPAAAVDVGGALARLGQREGLRAPALRLDATLVAELERGGQAVEVATALVALARALRTTVVAEGVETAGQAALLRALGCDLAQGPYVGSPVPAEAIGALLARSPGGEGGEIRPP